MSRFQGVAVMSGEHCGRRWQWAVHGRLVIMLRWLTAGESHGPELVAILEGLPAGVALTTADVEQALARRRLGYGRGARMKFEQDQVTIVGGVRHGRTMGSPVAIRVGNTEWPKW
jgi:chorismate synthase